MKSWPVGAFAGAKIPIGGEMSVFGTQNRSFEWASISKLFMTLCILICVEDGSCSLDDPLGPPTATVRHLLSHSSGMGLDGRLLCGIERKRIYSNQAFLLLQELVEERTEMTYIDFLNDAVCKPLGIGCANSDSKVTGASGYRGTINDLGALARELAHPTLIDIETMRVARSCQFPALDGITPGYGRFSPCDWGLGVELKGSKHPHWMGSLATPECFGHFGQGGGFLWIDPSIDIALAVLTDTPFGPWAKERWTAFSDRVRLEDQN